LNLHRLACLWISFVDAAVFASLGAGTQGQYRAPREPADSSVSRGLIGHELRANFDVFKYGSMKVLFTGVFDGIGDCLHAALMEVHNGLFTVGAARRRSIKVLSEPEAESFSCFLPFLPTRSSASEFQERFRRERLRKRFDRGFSQLSAAVKLKGESIVAAQHDCRSVVCASRVFRIHFGSPMRLIPSLLLSENLWKDQKKGVKDIIPQFSVMAVVLIHFVSCDSRLCILCRFRHMIKRRSKVSLRSALFFSRVLFY
jgi:hypothetical protein